MAVNVKSRDSVCTCVNVVGYAYLIADVFKRFFLQFWILFLNHHLSLTVPPALEHENKIIGESLDLIKYVDSHFEGHALLPDDPAKKEFAEELISYSDTFVKGVFTSFKGDAVKEAGAAFDYLETALHKFDDGPFFLGQKFSLVDIVYAPFLERHQIFFQDVWSYDIRSGRPKIAAFMEEMIKIGAYTQTKCDPKLLVETYKRMFLAQR
ncbi:unnamed protein product [Ilex paraguariensis]|uniref:GST C-terminal domain-containing protein n=1 Tax=Ilex paraguariensis TaxID=185542 RepID=A0ABC8T5R8_9AQUA